MQRSDLFNLNYYRQAEFTGSRGDVCYRLARAETETGDDGGEERLLLKWWRGPFSTSRTDEEMQEKSFPFTDEGLDAVVEFISQMDVKPMRGDLFEKVMKERGGL